MEYMVGGLPKARKFPFEYKAPFSPCDVIEEYTRPARYVENGKVVVSPAMSEAVLVDFDRIGTLEAFNTDGLRSLIYTMSEIPSMKEKTLRYPGHIKLIQALKSAGFFDTEPLDVGSAKIVPFDFTSQVLFKSWKLGEEEEEFTVMRIIIGGESGHQRIEITYDLYDEFDHRENLSSMARTTGFTATATVNMILDKVFTEKGVFPPELVGKVPGCFSFIAGYLNNRGVKFKTSERPC
jgi:lysine 6-dehydrogenase